MNTAVLFRISTPSHHIPPWSISSPYFHELDELGRLLREIPEKRLPAQTGGLSNLWKQSWYAGFDHNVACLQTSHHNQLPGARGKTFLVLLLTATNNYQHHL